MKKILLILLILASCGPKEEVQPNKPDYFIEYRIDDQSTVLLTNTDSSTAIAGYVNHNSNFDWHESYLYVIEELPQQQTMIRFGIIISTNGVVTTKTYDTGLSIFMSQYYPKKNRQDLVYRTDINSIPCTVDITYADTVAQLIQGSFSGQWLLHEDRSVHQIQGSFSLPYRPMNELLEVLK